MYSDAWVVDYTLFHYASQGSCSCCGGGGHAMMMNAALLKQLCSDIDTDDAKAHTEATLLCPWPLCIKEEIQRDMVAIRAKLKARSGYYQEFVANHFDAFSQWFLALSQEQKQSIFCMPVEEVQTIYEVTLDVKTAYRVLIAAVIQQVKHFRDTEYGSDGVTSYEQAFEQALRVKKGAFVLVEASDTIKSTIGGDADQPLSFSFFLQMLQHIGGGPTLLPKKEKESEKKNQKEASSSLSFQSDRRLVRLVIFRYFLDRAISRFSNQHLGLMFIYNQRTKNEAEQQQPDNTHAPS